MKESGFLLSCNSDYLRKQNWIQICLMGEIAREKVVALTNSLERVCFRKQAVDKSVPV
jgi:predicted DNA-binding protein (MmcQ/YjbR family)